VKVNDASLYFEMEGVGPPLILMHGAGSAIDDPEGSWAGLRGFLSTDFQTFSVEHRGHGRSDNPNQRFDYATLAADILAFADFMGLGRFDLAGISDGAIVGMELGIERPERVGRLALLGVNYRNDVRTLRANAAWAHIPHEPDASPSASQQRLRHDRGGKPAGSWRSLFGGLVRNVSEARRTRRKTLLGSLRQRF